jgi:protein-tyrosine phosphatase
MMHSIPTSLGLQSCPNFRDLGGYPTLHGRAVRRGRIFRAGTLAYLAEDDHDMLAPLGIRTICDLRHVSERELERTQWRDGSARTLSWDYRSPIRGMLTELSRPDAGPDDAVRCMEAFYAALPLALAPAIRDVFGAIAGRETPLLFHCSAGKDRTGVVAGLLLEILYVPRATILADYARSAELMDYERILAKNPDSSLGLARDGVSIATLARPLRACLLASEPRYLAATFAGVEAESGSAEAFLVDRIGVDLATIDAVRRELLD